VPGVVSPDLPSAFAHSAAYGDIIAAILALLALYRCPVHPALSLHGSSVSGYSRSLQCFLCLRIASCFPS